MFGECVIPSIRKSLKEIFKKKYKDKNQFKTIGTYVVVDEFDNEKFEEAMEDYGLEDEVDRVEYKRVRDSYKDAIRIFDNKWNLKVHRDNLSKFISWEKRGPTFIKRIMEEGPDIITMQEVDRFGFFLERLKDTYASSNTSTEMPPSISLPTKTTVRTSKHASMRLFQSWAPLA